MKKVTLSATAFLLIFGIASVASAAKTFETTATTVLNGVTFSPSTSVKLNAVATATAWAGISKHVNGGTSEYGLLSTDTNITIRKGLDAAADPSTPTDESTLGITSN